MSVPRLAAGSPVLLARRGRSLNSRRWRAARTRSRCSARTRRGSR